MNQKAVLRLRLLIVKTCFHGTLRGIRDSEGPIHLPLGATGTLWAAFEAAKEEDAVPKNTVALGWMSQEDRITIATQASAALLRELNPAAHIKS